MGRKKKENSDIQLNANIDINDNSNAIPVNELFNNENITDYFDYEEDPDYKEFLKREIKNFEKEEIDRTDFINFRNAISSIPYSDDELISNNYSINSNAISYNKLYYYLIHHGFPLFRLNDVLNLFDDDKEKLNLLNYLNEKFHSLFYQRENLNYNQKIFDNYKEELDSSSLVLKLDPVIFPDVSDNFKFIDEEKGKFIVFIDEKADVYKEIDRSKKVSDRVYINLSSIVLNFMNELSRFTSNYQIIKNIAEQSDEENQECEAMESKGDADLVRIFESLFEVGFRTRKVVKEKTISEIFHIDYKNAKHYILTPKKGKKKSSRSERLIYAKFIVKCIEKLHPQSTAFKDMIDELRKLDEYDWSNLMSKK